MWALISYNRPEKCKAVIDQILKVGCSTSGVVFVNGDKTGYDFELPENWKWFYSPENIGVCAAMNKVFELYPSEPYYGLICDDEFVYTEGWDIKLAEAAGRWNISHGNDGWQSVTRLHSYVTVGGDLVRECGWWSLPGLWHWYHDDVQELLARNLHLKRYCKDIRTEHKHYLAGKAEKDITYQAGESKKGKDQFVYNVWLQNEAPALIKRIKEKMNNG